MTKEEFVEQVSNLPGVGKKTAEALYAAGIHNMDQLKSKSVDDLKDLEGMTARTAKAVYDALHEGEAADEGADKIEVVEAKQKTKGKAAKEAKKATTEEKPEVVEAEKVYRPKIKAELSEELQKALQIRELRASQEPAFARYHKWHSKRVPDAWRAPKGVLSKQRRGFKYRPPRVKVGYGKPAATRGLHPSGFEEVLVANPDELALVVDPKTQAARIVGTVGARKRALIEKAAAEKNIRILNPRRT
ncbi:MAG TPA: 50S ribosomal protein L32e [Candidatus Thermoplasmatota archaeon]|nr:50S ribosomal protein L32e [Candidatus Thermoplasmatota archaeon]